MPTVVTLKRVGLGMWSIYSSTGHLITGPHRLTLITCTPLKWAENFVECWGWTVKLEEDDEKQNKVSTTNI